MLQDRSWIYTRIWQEKRETSTMVCTSARQATKLVDKLLISPRSLAPLYIHSHSLSLGKPERYTRAPPNRLTIRQTPEVPHWGKLWPMELAKPAIYTRFQWSCYHYFPYPLAFSYGSLEAARTRQLISCGDRKWEISDRRSDQQPITEKPLAIVPLTFTKHSNYRSSNFDTKSSTHEKTFFFTTFRDNGKNETWCDFHASLFVRLISFYAVIRLLSLDGSTKLAICVKIHIRNHIALFIFYN